MIRDDIDTQTITLSVRVGFNKCKAVAPKNLLMTGAHLVYL